MYTCVSIYTSKHNTYIGQIYSPLKSIHIKAASAQEEMRDEKVKVFRKNKKTLQNLSRPCNKDLGTRKNSTKVTLWELGVGRKRFGAMAEPVDDSSYAQLSTIETEESIELIRPGIMKASLKPYRNQFQEKKATSIHYVVEDLWAVELMARQTGRSKNCVCWYF